MGLVSQRLMRLGSLDCTAEETLAMIAILLLAILLICGSNSFGSSKADAMFGKFAISMSTGQSTSGIL